MIKTTWIKPHEAVESFGWTFVDDFDVLKLYVHRLPAKAAKVSSSDFLKIFIYSRGTLEGKKLHS